MNTKSGYLRDMCGRRSRPGESHFVSTDEASAILDVLKAAKACAWPRVVDMIVKRGRKPADVCRAWRRLEEIAGRRGTAPTPEDF